MHQVNQMLKSGFHRMMPTMIFSHHNNIDFAIIKCLQFAVVLFHACKIGITRNKKTNELQSEKSDFCCRYSRIKKVADKLPNFCKPLSIFCTVPFFVQFHFLYRVTGHP